MSYFESLKTPKDLLQYTLMRGTTDWTQLEQFNLYEKGFPFLVVVSIPDFLKKMAQSDTAIKSLIQNYVHVLEYEFKGMSGLNDMSANFGNISNGFNEFQVITRTQEQGSESFSFSYTEKSGSLLTKVHELYLRGVRDPNSGFKHYNGLIGDSDIDDANKGKIQYDVKDSGSIGFEKETFSFLYMHTDNTGLQLERAVFLVGCQPTNVPYNIYNADKGTVDFAEVNLDFTGYPIYGSEVDKRAKAILQWMMNESNAYHVARNSYNYNWSRVSSKNFKGQETFDGLSDGLQQDHMTDPNTSGDASWIAT